MRIQIIIGLASATSLAAGVGLGYVISTRRLEAKYAKISSEEIAEARRFYSMVNKTEEFATPEKAAKALDRSSTEENPDTESVERARDAADALRGYRGGESGPNPAEKIGPFTQYHRNVFVDGRNNPDFDYEAEAVLRDPDHPYLITQDEIEEPNDYENVTYTYYAGDGVLCDIRDEIIEDVDAAVGLANLERFGEGSNDPNVVLVRHVKRQLDIEIIRHHGKYSVEVAGLDDEIQHSYERMPRRRRRLDE